VRRNSGGNPSGKPKRMVPDPAYQGVNIMGKMSDKDMANPSSLARGRETGKLTDKDVENAMEVIEELNPGKSIDVTEMAMGGYMDDKMVKRMMGGGYMNYKDKM
jgi:hypothetical protein